MAQWLMCRTFDQAVVGTIDWLSMV